MQTEKAKSSHFDRTRGDKNQIFPTLVQQKWFSWEILECHIKDFPYKGKDAASR